jgi:hypothetical protein
MGIHGVDEDEYLKTGNQKELLGWIKNSDRVLSF